MDNPFPVEYDPSTDLSDILDPECSSFYQHLIGVMRWMVELGHIDVGTKTRKFPLPVMNMPVRVLG